MTLQFNKSNKFYCTQDPEIVFSKDAAKESNFANGNQTLDIF